MPCDLGNIKGDSIVVESGKDVLRRNITNMLKVCMDSEGFAPIPFKNAFLHC